MNKKNIVSKVILFVFIMMFIILFKTLLGPKNTLIGVMTITEMLLFLQVDMTANPIKNTVKLVVLNILSGVAAFVASSNMWLAIPVNFITCFILGYSFCYSLKKAMYLPLSLQYLFMLTIPITIDLLPRRLFALFIGASLIMIVQFVVNRGKVSKKGNLLLSNTCELLMEKIQYMKEEKDTSKITKDIKQNIGDFKRLIGESKKDDFYINEEYRVKLGIAVSLKKLNGNLSNIKLSEETIEGLNDIYSILNLGKQVVDKKTSIDNIEKEFNETLNKYKGKKEENIDVLKCIYSIIYINDRISELGQLSKKDVKAEEKKMLIPERYTLTSRGKNQMSPRSIKFPYGLRFALGVTIAAFLTDFFNLSEGRWMIFTVLSLIVPIYESSKIKLKDRIFGTTIGAVFAFVLYGIFTEPGARTMLLMATGYINSFIPKYKYNTIGVAISAIGSAAIASGVHEIMTINRIFLVIAGAIIAMLINRFFFPYCLEDETKELKIMGERTLENMLNEIYDLVDGNGNRIALTNNIVLMAMIEEKLTENNLVGGRQIELKYIEKEKDIVSSIYELYVWIETIGISNESKELIFNDIKLLMKVKDLESLEGTVKDLDSHIRKVENMEEKVVIIMMEDMLRDLYKLKLLEIS